MSQFTDEFLYQWDLRKPIANSFEEMPAEAATVAKAIRARVTVDPRESIRDVRFSREAEDKLTQLCPTVPGFVSTGALLYLLKQRSQAPEEKYISGQLNFEGPSGMRASVRYDARYHKTENFVLVEEVHVAPLYSDSPEPLMFIVPVDTLRIKAIKSSKTFGELLQFVAKHAITPIKPASLSLPENDYVIFIFFLDQISPTASVRVKISDESTSINGYEDNTQYLDFGGWHVAALPGRFALPGTQTSPPLYVKAGYTPGKEARLLPLQKLVGLYHLSGANPLY